MLEFPTHTPQFKRFDRFRDRSDQTEWVIQEIQPRVSTTRYRLQSMTSSTMIWRTEDDLVVKFDHLPWGGTPKPKDGCEWPQYVREFVITPEIAVAFYRQAFGPDADEMRAELRGHDLVCWCPIGQPCHASILLELANA